MRKGYVYVLSNPCMEGIVKIGQSMHGGEIRAKNLYGNITGVPAPFEVEFEVYVDDYKGLEKSLHKKLDYCRVNPKREFFKISVDSAIASILEHKLSAMSRAQYLQPPEMLKNIKIDMNLTGEDFTNPTPVQPSVGSTGLSRGNWMRLMSRIGIPLRGQSFLERCRFSGSADDALTLDVSKADLKTYYNDGVGRCITGALSAHYGRVFTLKLNANGSAGNAI